MEETYLNMKAMKAKCTANIRLNSEKMKQFF